MKLNDTLDVISYQADTISLSFILDATKSDALAATEGKDLELNAGSSTVGIWKGWTITGAVDYTSKSGDGSDKTYTMLTAARKLSPDTASEIASLENNINIIRADVDSVKVSTDDIENNVNNIASSINPQVNTLAKMQVATMDLTQDTDDAVANINTLLPDFVKENHEYKTGDSFVYDDKTYRVAQNHTSQSQWKPGDVGTESLYYEIVIASDGILVWRTPVGAHDAPSLNSLRHYPDADGPVYVSKKDGNTSVPGTDEWWELM